VAGATLVHAANLQPAAAPSTEQVLRARLAIPADARRIIILGESSHWDPNWLRTSQAYYLDQVVPILDQVIDALVREPRRVFSIESLFFLRLYWELKPLQRGLIRGLFNQGQLRLTGTGITTPDTVLPGTESLLRDYLFGQEWLWSQGLTVEPRLAYFPDSFGHSPALPSILRALDMDMAAVTRIDGMHFVASDLRPRSAFPLRGSSAEILQQASSADFVWRGPDGAEVLCHWNAHTYFQGDLLAHLGIVRWMDVPAAVSWRTSRHVARRINGFVRQLEGLAATPYVFCPIGCDFVKPIRGLLDLVDRYNHDYYPQTGIWAVNAGLDDYLALVDCHRGRLPVLALDPNPYWMGFYASRPHFKRACNRIERELVRAEKLATLRPNGKPWRRDARQAWELLVLANHHDFITGTSPDRTVRAEQRPWLVEAAALAAQTTTAVMDGQRPPRSARARSPGWELRHGCLRVETNDYRLTLSEAAGGCLTSLEFGNGEQLVGPANDLCAYSDSGGLWRLGHEFRGGRFRLVEQSSAGPAHVDACERDGLLEVRITSLLRGRPFVRWLWLRAHDPVIRLRVQGAVAAGHSLTCRFPLRLRANRLRMDVPGGLVERPAHKLHAPTFWPARSFAHVSVDDRAAGSDDPQAGMAVFLGGPAAISLQPPGTLEWLAARNARKERAFGFIPILCHPIGGSTPEEQALDYAVCFTSSGGVIENRLPALARRVLSDEYLSPGGSDAEALAAQAVTCDRADVLVGAVKPAGSGQGVIARLECFVQKFPLTVHLRAARAIQSARLCTARERDLRSLPIVDGAVVVPIDGSITSVRLVLDGGD
jgi:hypothetical protein